MEARWCSSSVVKSLATGFRRVALLRSSVCFPASSSHSSFMLLPSPLAFLSRLPSLMFMFSHIPSREQNSSCIPHYRLLVTRKKEEPLVSLCAPHPTSRIPPIKECISHSSLWYLFRTDLNVLRMLLLPVLDFSVRLIHNPISCKCSIGSTLLIL